MVLMKEIPAFFASNPVLSLPAMSDPFLLAERLAADTVAVLDLAPCRVLLMDNCLFPWLILVPRRPGLRELHALAPADRARLVEEAAATSALVERLFQTDKVNIGMLGNLVPQLHCHVVGRRTGD